MRTTTNTAGGRARGGLVPAAVLMVLVGVWPLLRSVAVLVQADSLAVGPEHPNQSATTAAIWVSLVLGAVIAASGYCLLSGSGRVRAAGAGLAAVSALAALFYLPSHPWWALLTIGLDIFVVCALIIAPAD